MNSRIFAALKHKGQTRKFTGLPYIIHPYVVADIVGQYTDGEGWIDENRNVYLDVAYLHDTLEDTDTTLSELESHFGNQVAQDVLSLTNVEKSFGNRKARKHADNERLSIASPVAQTVKLADIMDNVPSMLLYKSDFGRRYLKEKLKTVEILKDANPKLLELVRNYLKQLKKEFGG